MAVPVYCFEVSAAAAIAVAAAAVAAAAAAAAVSASPAGTLWSGSAGWMSLEWN